MSRHESDREDLMREAVALRRRIELHVPGAADTVIAGFRREGGLSLYFGGDPMYQFDEQGRLRRAFVKGRLYRTEGRTLAQLTRVRTPSQTELQREDLPPDALQAFLSDMQTAIAEMQAALRGSQVRIVQQVPEDDRTLVSDLAAALGRIRNAEEPLAPSMTAQ